MSQQKIYKTIAIETTSIPDSIESHGFVYSDNFKRIERITAKFDGFNKEYFVPDGVIRKPSLYLVDIFPDLNAESFFVLSNLAYLITSDLKFFII